MKKKLRHIYNSKDTFEKHVHLLLLLNTKNSHYVLIKDFNRLSSRILKSHKENCLSINHIKPVLLPEEGTYNEFRIFKRLVKASFVI